MLIFFYIGLVKFTLNLYITRAILLLLSLDLFRPSDFSILISTEPCPCRSTYMRPRASTGKTMRSKAGVSVNLSRTQIIQYLFLSETPACKSISSSHSRFSFQAKLSFPHLNCSYYEFILNL